MLEMFDKAKTWILKITELGLLLVALAIVLQMLFGTAVPSWAAMSSATCSSS